MFLRTKLYDYINLGEQDFVCFYVHHPVLLNERDQPRAALEKLRNPYLLNFYERLAGSLFTAVKVRLWQSNAESAE